jgi:glycerol-3-phosphate dehydrogenase
LNHRHTGTTAQAAPATQPDAARECDVLIVGGGINGAGIARDLAGRGLSVVLCEKDDLAAHTSSSSTKLIHGGLRYLEYYEFSLVRKALAEREVLLKSAPHIMWPLRFVMPHDPSMRPALMIRAGLFLYDHLARREVLPGSEGVDLRRHPAGQPLKPQFKRGFVYSDGWVDDARLVVLNAVDAVARGAQVLTGWRCTDAQRVDKAWQVTLTDNRGNTQQWKARALVNAAGPWAAQFLHEHAHLKDTKSLRLVKGSHIVVKKLFDHDHAYIFQNPDRRIIFAIPYEGEFTLIGTTDVESDSPIGKARIDDSEIAYLCEQASRYFDKPIVPTDVVWTYAGVRPLMDDESSDASAVTRDYLLDFDTSGAPNAPVAGPPQDRGEPPRGAAAKQPGAPLLTVWGGKITTFRKLAEEAADGLCKRLQQPQPAWTANAFLPGGDLSAWIGPPQRPDTDFERFDAVLAKRHPHWPAATRRRLARCYGSRIEMVAGAQGLGEEIAPGLHEAELVYLHEHEWARSAEDVLWRRTKLGLHITEAQRQAVARWWAARWPAEAPTEPMNTGDNVRTTTWS